MKTYWIDLFCGAGGTTTGIHLSDVNASVIACVNHDAEAIKTHQANHPDCLHLTEDIRDWNVISKLSKLVSALRSKEPNCIINLWASLECTHFSKAKGGMARDADSRTLAEHLYYYVIALKPDFVYLENVAEFMTWGPVDEHGKPIPEFKSVDYDRWVVSLKLLGYNYDHRLLNAADFGAHTSRERYFGVFAKEGYQIVFPKPTHARKSKLKDGLKQWRPVREVLDLSIVGNSIFGLTKNGKPYSDATLERIYHGLIKFSKEGLFIKRYNGGSPSDKSRSVHEPLGTILTNHTHAVVETVFLTSYYGNGNAHSIEDPCNTLTTKDRYAAHFIHSQYGTPTNGSIEEPAGTIPSNNKHNLVEARFTIDFQFNNKGRSIERPGQTLIARMDKSPVYLVEAKNGEANEPLVNDSKVKIRIRQFMIEHGISDITIRMLTISELKAIQGFPADYVLTGSKTDQLKFIGNSVVPLMAKKLVEANYYSLISTVAA